MRMMAHRPVVIAAGGTGGHFYPAEALAAELLRRGECVVLLTDARSGGLASPVFAQTERYVISGAGLSGRGLKRATQGAFALARGVVEARRILRALRPAALVAFGGYPAVPPVLAAASLFGARPRVILHEQNAVLGRANRFLARRADVLALNFANTLGVPAGVTVRVVGNPVRPAIAVLHGAGYAAPAERIELLILGGSLGAKLFGTLLPEALAALPETLRARLNVTQQCRKEELEQARRTFAAAGIAAELAPFFTDVAALLAKAHLVVSRAGASSVAEIAAVGRPAIFIPLPGAIDDHQRANADALGATGAARRVDQAGLTPAILAEQIESLLMDSANLTNMARAATAAGRVDAAAKLADMVLEGVPA
ncbi:undecaprenyldiphospho-muramoylpentapeptide beta-N-acetylglucosaminyltransferase [Acidocella sp.]|uniref:undecaprenyldiphospho-muramoylpentapeptide beta-N-acetylglucosaminyltransferase n=1 Tax=Acidocella sp. TaxID=50710 RepID=UPI00260EC653|nr:undecaprenyldiphospho-muramoylpentapeptide beta-N-acetylglucosaminyltransferase [Acidocella sp.]